MVGVQTPMVGKGAQRVTFFIREGWHNLGAIFYFYFFLCE